MNWLPIVEERKSVVVNATGLAAYDEEKCKFCGRYGCTDRGYTLSAGEPPVALSEAEWVVQVQDKLADLIEAYKEDVNIYYTRLAVPQCVRKLKKSNMQTVLETLATCGPDCHRNLNCADGGIEGGVWKERGEDYHCPFRGEYMECQRNRALDLGLMLCLPDKEGLIECEFHEEAYRRCFRRKEGEPCYNLKDKLGVADERLDSLLLLAHRFSVAPCRYCDGGTCGNKDSLHHEGVCTLKGLMAACQHYAPVGPEQAYTEGVCTYVSSVDGKDDRKIFNNSGYVSNLNEQQAHTLCTACRISHSIAMATGLKCLGVRRSVSNPFLNETNPMHQYAVQVNYLFMTHPEDVAKYDPEQIAEAVCNGIMVNCEGLGCDEIETCKVYRRTK